MSLKIMPNLTFNLAVVLWGGSHLKNCCKYLPGNEGRCGNEDAKFTEISDDLNSETGGVGPWIILGVLFNSGTLCL